MTDANQEAVKAVELQLLELVRKELYFSEGLLGFPNCQRYSLLVSIPATAAIRRFLFSSPPSIIYRLH